ncbi:MAG: DUF1801 domain-containing protein [Bacteroidota bacterium]|nr:DUF1801 domain-containing protein [Bacteroidota bacterium]
MNHPSNIDAYIQQFPSEVQTILQQIRTTVQQTLPGLKETIKYGIPTFVFEEKNVIHFGAFTNHIGFYPMPAGIEEFEEELSHYKRAKGSVQFPLNEPMPLDLIRRMVLFNLNKIERKKEAKTNVKIKRR